MRTPRGWFVSALSIPFIGLNAWAAWAIHTAAPPPECGPFPNCADVPTTNPPIFLLGAAVSAAFAILGVLGIVEFARRGSVKWSAIPIISTLVWWTLVFFVALAGGGPGY